MNSNIDNRVWRALGSALIGRSSRSSNTGFTNYCCPLCIFRGHSRPDRKHRCGIKYVGETIGINCFNCHFKSRYRLGELLGSDMRFFLEQMGVPKRDVKMLNFWAEQIRTQLANDPSMQHQLNVIATPEFPTIDLPSQAHSLQTWASVACDEADYHEAVSYLRARGSEIAGATTYFWTPITTHDLHRRIIIPCYCEQRLVGWTARATSDDIAPRYIKETPSHLLFNIDLLRAPKRAYILLVEGVFDALAIDGIAALGGSLNEQQIAWINQSEKQVIVVPDRDRAGSHLIDIAIQQNWPVATPHYGKHQWWDADIKDAAAAVQRYGKLFTLRSIITTCVHDAGQIRQRTSYRIQ